MTGDIPFKAVEEIQFRKWLAWPSCDRGLYSSKLGSLVVAISIIIKAGLCVTPRNCGFLHLELKITPVENVNQYNEVKGYLTVGVKGKDRHGIRVDNPEARWCQFPRGKSILAESSRVLFVKLASPQQVVYIFCPPVDFLWSQLLDARTPHTFLPHECQSRFHSLATETTSQLSRASEL